MPTSSVKALIKKSDLRYSSDHQKGYSRRRCGKGFIYLGKRGTTLKGKRTLRRIENLVIPPAWNDVWICSHPNGHLQATGKDERHRKQYIYHPGWVEIRDKTKFDQLVDFGKALPTIRRTANRDLKRSRYSKRWVLALTVSIMDETLIRVGNTQYARNNKSYGITTLRNRHLEVEDEQVIFDFEGKSGKQQHIVLDNRKLIECVSHCQDLPGQTIFQYVANNGAQVPLLSEDLNTYLKEISGVEITAKYFRTWGATVEAASILKTCPCPHSSREKQKILTSTVREVANLLGNTPAVAKRSYIAPIIVDLYKRGVLSERMRRKRSSIRGLTADEQSVLELLHKI